MVHCKEPAIYTVHREERSLVTLGSAVLLVTAGREIPGSSPGPEQGVFFSFESLVTSKSYLFHDVDIYFMT